MSNTSATGGYLVPASSAGFPSGESLTQFIQTILVGISGFTDPSLVRPDWQIAPPNNPDITVDWIGFGVAVTSPDANAYVNSNDDGSSTLVRQERLEIRCHFYGPNCMDISTLVRDGFQIQQNLEALERANLGFAYVEDAVRIPDLINERWCDRVQMSVFLRRQQVREYPVLPLLSAKGTIKAEGSQIFSEDWKAPQGD